MFVSLAHRVVWALANELFTDSAAVMFAARASTSTSVEFAYKYWAYAWDLLTKSLRSLDVSLIKSA